MFGWMCRLFKKLKLGIDAQPLTPIDKLKKTHKKLKKKSQTYKNKASQEVRKEKEFRRAGDEKAAKLCLSRKMLHEQQIEQLGKFQFQIDKLMIKLEGVKATTETVDALKIGAAELKEMQSAINIDDGGETMNEMNELIASLGQSSLPATTGAVTDFDEDEPDAELEEREGADPVPQRTA